MEISNNNDKKPSSLQFMNNNLNSGQKLAANMLRLLIHFKLNFKYRRLPKRDTCFSYNVYPCFVFFLLPSVFFSGLGGHNLWLLDGHKY